MNLVVDGVPTYAYTGARAWVSARPVVLFVHGAAHDHSVWALQSRYVAHHGCNVLALDLPGHGRSAGAALNSIEAMADWLIAVLDAVGASRAELVGHSMGALAALECAGRYPQRVSRIALLGPAVPMEVSDALLDAAASDEHLAYELINSWSFAPAHRLGGNPMPGVWMTGNAMRLLERNRPGVLAADLLACKRYANGLAAAAKVQCPALLILAARDLMAPMRNAGALFETLRHKKAVTLPASGHALMVEEPDAVLNALQAFLEFPRAESA